MNPSRRPSSTRLGSIAPLLALGLLAVAAPGEAPGAEYDRQPPKAARVVEEVVVTARRRDEGATDVPASVSVLSDIFIEAQAIRDLTEIVEVVPNLQLAQGTGASSQYVIRGIDDNARNAGFDNRVAVYVDGVFTGSSGGRDVMFVDVAQVEVLRGPQGTEFGRNSTTGAINIVTHKPDGELRGYLQSGVENHDGIDLRGLVNVPVIDDTLFFKGAAIYRDHDGYYDSLVAGGSAGDLRSLSGSAQLRYLPTDRLDTMLSVYVFDNDHERSFNGESAIDGAPEPFVINTNTFPGETRNVLASLAIDYDLGNGFRFTSISTYSDSTALLVHDEDGLPANLLISRFDDSFDNFTQEFRLTSPAGDRFEYLVGLYYLTMTSTNLRDLPVVGDTTPLLGVDLRALNPVFGVPGAHATVDTRSLSLYGTSTVHLTDRVHLDLGARFSDEKKDLDLTLGDLRPVGVLPPQSLQRTKSDSSIAPRAALRFDWAADSTVYAAWSRGFKSGGFNADFISDPLSLSTLEFDQERADNFEIGWKSRWLGGRLQTELIAFRMEIEDYQINQFLINPNPPPPASVVLRNAAEVRSEGVEFDVSAQLFEGLTLRVSGAFLDAKFVRFPDGGGIGVDLDGRQLTLAAEESVSASLSYNRPLSSRLNLFANATISYLGQRGPSPLVGDPLLPDYTVWNGSAGVATSDGQWTFSVWGRNIADELYRLGTGANGLGVPFTTYGAPRTYGASVRYAF